MVTSLSGLLVLKKLLLDGRMSRCVRWSRCGQKMPRGNLFDHCKSSAQCSSHFSVVTREVRFRLDFAERVHRREASSRRQPLADNAQQTTYSMPYPTSLSGQCSIKNRYFTTHQRCPVTAPQLCCKAKSLIVRRLAEELNASLSRN